MCSAIYSAAIFAKELCRRLVSFFGYVLIALAQNLPNLERVRGPRDFTVRGRGLLSVLCGV